MFLLVIAREGGRSSIPETPVIEPRSRGVLDHPPSRVMTARDLGGLFENWIGKLNCRPGQASIASAIRDP